MTTPEPVDVTFTVDLSTVVGRHHRQISEDDYTTEDETLGDRIASLVAEKVYRAHKDVWASYERRQEVTEAVDRAIDARVSEALSRPITPTDQYGQPKGEPTTLGEIIDWRLAEWFKAAKADAGYQRQQVSNLDALIEKAVSSGQRRSASGYWSAGNQASASVRTERPCSSGSPIPCGADPAGGLVRRDSRNGDTVGGVDVASPCASGRRCAGGGAVDRWRVGAGRSRNCRAWVCSRSAGRPRRVKAARSSPTSSGSPTVSR